MISAIEYWSGSTAISTYGWPLDDPATGEPLDAGGLSFRIRVFLPAGVELLLPGRVAAAAPLIDGVEVSHPAVLLVDIAPGDIEADPGRYTLAFEVSDGSGWQVMPIRDQSIIVR